MLIALAAIMAISYVVIYVQAGLDDTGAFSSLWYILFTGVLYAAAVITMPEFGKIGWYIYLLALVFTVICELISFTLRDLPIIFMTLFIILFLLDDEVKEAFGVKFKVQL
ncbi:MAG: hypothetical protein WCR83_01880 [Candidatus Methanomethylophilaceae archaeon]